MENILIIYKTNTSSRIFINLYFTFYLNLISDFTTSVKKGFSFPGKPNHHSGNPNKNPETLTEKEEDAEGLTQDMKEEGSTLSQETTVEKVPRFDYSNSSFQAFQNLQKQGKIKFYPFYAYQLF